MRVYVVTMGEGAGKILAIFKSNPENCEKTKRYAEAMRVSTGRTTRVEEFELFE